MLHGEITTLDLVIVGLYLIAMIAGMIAGFVVCVGWKLAGLPFGLGAAVPGAIACAIALVCVSLATYKKHPSVFLAAE